MSQVVSKSAPKKRTASKLISHIDDDISKDLDLIPQPGDEQIDPIAAELDEAYIKARDLARQAYRGSTWGLAYALLDFKSAHIKRYGDSPTFTYKIAESELACGITVQRISQLLGVVEMFPPGTVDRRIDFKTYEQARKYRNAAGHRTKSVEEIAQLVKDNPSASAIAAMIPQGPRAILNSDKMLFRVDITFRKPFPGAIVQSYSFSELDLEWTINGEFRKLTPDDAGWVELAIPELQKIVTDLTAWMKQYEAANKPDRVDFEE